jgi:hypothetical protein
MPRTEQHGTIQGKLGQAEEILKNRGVVDEPVRGILYGARSDRQAIADSAKSHQRSRSGIRAKLKKLLLAIPQLR